MKVGHLLRGHARRDPDRTAVICNDTALSFGVLDRRSDRFANALLDRGLEAGDRVVVYVGNSLALVEAVAGAFKAGAVVVPVSIWIVGRELEFMVGDCAPFAVIYGPEQRAAVDAALAAHPGVTRIYAGADVPDGAVALEALFDAGAEAPPPALAPMPDDAVIGYTSGTTGHPKGAIGTHANLIFQSLYISTFTQPLSADSVRIITTPIAHRTGFQSLAAAFVVGVPTVVLPRFDPARCVEAIERYNVTAMNGVPTVVRLLLDYLETTDHRLPSLRTMSMTGEPFPAGLKKRLFDRLPHVGLYAVYALTEGGVPATLMPHEHDLKPDSCGRVCPGVEVRLIDEGGRDAAPGESGEIVVRSGEPGRAGVMRGYHNRPDANAEAFFEGSWFRTGDVGRFDEDGYLYIVDRSKDMILSGGLNIYSQEVEQALDRHPAVGEAAVVAGPDAEYGECVVAYIVLRPGAHAEAEELIEHCRGEIASYKKPKHVFFVDRLPRNANGKVMKAELRTQARAALTQAAGV